MRGSAATARDPRNRGIQRAALLLTTLSCLALGLALGAFPGTAKAQEADLAQARALFAVGVEQTEAGDFSGAAASFRQALAIRQAPAIEYNLASALIELEQFQEAEALLLSVLANDESNDVLRGTARQARGDLRARAGEVRIQRQPDSTAEVWVDGQALSEEQEFGGWFLAPGPHAVELRRGDELLGAESPNIRPGEVALVRFSVAPLGLPTSITNGDDDIPLGAEPDSAATTPWLIVGTVIAAVLTIGIIAGLTSDGDADARSPGVVQPTPFSPLRF